MIARLVFIALCFTLASCYWLPASDRNIFFNGRWDKSNIDSPRGDWSGISVSIDVRNITEFTVLLSDSTGNSEADVILTSSNGVQEILPYNITTQIKRITITNLQQKFTYNITVFKRTEPDVGIITFYGFSLSDGTIVYPPQDHYNRRIEFIGDSITCGYGDLGVYPCTWSPETEENYVSYGQITGRALNAQVYLEAWSGKGLVRNYDYPNITSPEPLPWYYPKTIASQSNSTTWTFQDYSPQAIVINLGTNDYSTEPYPPENVFVPAYAAFIKQILNFYRVNSPSHIFLVCGPMIGQPCCGYVKQAAYNNGATYIDLQGILNYPQDYGCDGHPGKTGHEKMAAATIPIIQKTMGWN
eukprot:TRINITY_DN2007_c0_g1_i1.p1 TRINITY_DN2007_c0_g1~~TRINITY_DN2007_c0_g1_i1.p1  ORF type:complete len:357 (-),score=56.28 TRINITY_DN2007_c0_g1_i1:93-1163(-)